MKCKHWTKPIPDSFGDKPECAFPRGRFHTKNWNCYLMNKLRTLAEKNMVWAEDQYYSIIPFSYGHCCAFLSWYKSRGRTESFLIVNFDHVRKGTEKDAKRIVEEYADELKKLERASVVVLDENGELMNKVCD